MNLAHARINKFLYEKLASGEQKTNRFDAPLEFAEKREK